VNITAVKAQFFGNRVVGQIQSHKIEAQYPHFERLVMFGKNDTGEIIEAFSALFAFIALFGGFLIIKTFFDCACGTTKWALTAFYPTQFANNFIALYVIYQGLFCFLLSDPSVAI